LIVGFASVIKTNAKEYNQAVYVGKVNYEKYETAKKIQLAYLKELEDQKLAQKNREIEEARKELELENKIVKFIKKSNNKVEHKAAYDLATAVIRESRRQDIPIKILLAIIKVESAFNKDAVGTSGEVSYFQVMPKLHLDKVEKLHKENVINSTNLANTKTNTAVGATVLKSCFNRYTAMDMKLACYNGSQKDEEKTYAKKVLKQVALTKL